MLRVAVAKQSGTAVVASRSPRRRRAAPAVEQQRRGRPHRRRRLPGAGHARRTVHHSDRAPGRSTAAPPSPMDVLGSLV